MLRVGLTGGIGSGKSTVAERLAGRGAVVIDADQVAREVVAPGSSGLAELVEEFGAEILDADGALDRPAMARRVFADNDARATLNGIVHPRIGIRTAELMDQAPADAIVVHDVPLLVENRLAPGYHLVIVVDAPVEERVRRLVARGLEEDDARKRIEAQATDEQRREVADVWLDNSGPVAGLLESVDWVWSERLVDFEANVRLGRPHSRTGPPRLVGPDPEWPRQARRLTERITFAAGERAVRVDHIGSTSVPGLAAKDVIDLQVTVGSLVEADGLAGPLAEAGFPVVSGITQDRPKPAAHDPAQWAKRMHASADPCRPVNVHVRVIGTAAWRFALLFPDWLRADAQARAEYEAFKRELADRHSADATPDAYAEAKEPWFDDAFVRAQEWAERTGWTPPSS